MGQPAAVQLSDPRLRHNGEQSDLEDFTDPNHERIPSVVADGSGRLGDVEVDGDTVTITWRPRGYQEDHSTEQLRDMLQTGDMQEFTG